MTTNAHGSKVNRFFRGYLDFATNMSESFAHVEIMVGLLHHGAIPSLVLPILSSKVDR